MKIVQISLAVLLLAAMASVPAAAQTSLGTITGSVTDASGAFVPGVTITVTNEGTGSTRTVTSNEAGSYTIPSLPPAVYTLEATMEGFQKAVQRGVRLEVNQTLRVDLELRIGELTEIVEVSAAAPQLQTESATVATTVDNEKVVELPLNGRSFTQLTVLVPGAVGGSGANTGFQTSGTSVSISGLRSEANNYTLDGVNNNESFFKTYGLQPSIDAIQEFKVQTNITSAEFGSAAGANVNIVTKSGTNSFHGTGYFFHRNDNFDATDFFANRSGTGKPEFRNNQFGGTIGGPIVQNNTFFFANYEGQRRGRNSTILSTVPTAAQVAGDLSLDVTGVPAAPIFDPFTTVENPDGSLSRDPFPNNRIPSSMLSSAATDYAARLYPAPNLPGQASNFVNTKPNSLDGDQWMIRIDQRLSDMNNMMGRFNFNDSEALRPTGLTTVDNTLVNTFTNAMIADTHTFGPTTILDMRIGYHRNNLQVADSAPGGLAAVEQFLSNNPISGVPVFKNENVPLFPQVNIAGFTGISQSGFPFPDDTYNAIVSLTKITGNHTLKFGFEFRHNRNLDDGFFTGIFSFNGDATNDADPQSVDPSGQGIASFLLGLPDVAQRNIGAGTTAIMRKEDYSFYVQDDWKVTPRLTMNLGLRADLIEWPKHRDDLLASVDISTGEFLWDGVNPITGEPPNVRRGIVEPDRNNFAPRVGLAYRLGEKNTVRAGYGIFYMSNFLWETQGVRGNWPFAISETLNDLNDRFPNSPIESTFSPALDVGPGVDVQPSAQHIINRRNRVSYTQQWNFHIQRQLVQDLMIEVGYVGTKGTKLSAFLNANTALPGPGDVQPRRPFPDLTPMSRMSNEVSSNYHGLQFKVDKRFSDGISMRANYAWGKTIDVGGAGFSASATPQNPLDFQADRGLSALHREHTFTLDYIWQLPFGRGRRYGANMSGPVDAILGGWQLTGIITANSGGPFNVGIPRDIANIGPRSVAQRPNLAGDPFTAGTEEVPELWFNTAAFSEPAAFTFGNLGRNALIGPSQFQFDFGLYKNFNVWEGVDLQFRSEFFNFFNNVNFSPPDSNFDSATFGQVLGSAPARQIQFGLKVIF